MKISVVVPAFNEERLLPGSLSSIRAAMQGFDRFGWASELIVCDNNSTDRTAEIAEGAGAQVVFEPVNRISRARNAGAERAAGDWIFFVDADSTPTVELFLDAAEAIHGGCLAGGSTIAFDRPPRGGALAAGIWNALSRIAGWAAGSFIFCEAAAFREAGGFSEILVGVSKSSYDLLWISVRDAAANLTTIRFSGMRKGAGVKDSAFTLQIPNGADIVELGQ